MNYELIDGVQMHALHPLTFAIPSDEDKAKIKSGDFVKVGFIPVDELGTTERIWVKVTGVEGDRLTGEVDNDPFLFPPEILKLGDLVDFTLRNVLCVLSQ